MSRIHSIAQPSPSGRSLRVQAGEELRQRRRRSAGDRDTRCFGPIARRIGGDVVLQRDRDVDQPGCCACVSVIQRCRASTSRACTWSNGIGEHASLLGRALEDQRSGRVQEIHRPGAGHHRQVRRQGAGARRALPDHGGPAQIPPLRRDRISDLRAGRRLLHLATNTTRPPPSAAAARARSRPSWSMAATRRNKFFNFLPREAGEGDRPLGRWRGLACSERADTCPYPATLRSPYLPRKGGGGKKI